MDHGLVGFVAAVRKPAETSEQARMNADGDELFCLGGFGAADTAGALQLGVSGLGDIGKINLTVGNKPDAPCGSPGGR